jgi:hypothetical protein
MSRPPLTLALRLVLAASVEGASRLRLLSNLHDTPEPPALAPMDTLTAAETLTAGGIHTPARAQSRTGSRRVPRSAPAQPSQPGSSGPAAPGQAAPGQRNLATVLTMPRVIPMHRPRSAPDDHHPDHDPSAA